MRRATEMLVAAAEDEGDDFLHYLFGMAILHMDEKARVGEIPPVDAAPPNDPQIAVAARLIEQAKNCGTGPR